MIEKIQEIDKYIALFFPKHYYQHPYFNQWMIVITTIGNLGMIWLAIIFILLFHISTRLLAIKICLALIIATLVGQIIIKSYIQRPRPCHTFSIPNQLIKTPKDSSFPSGHTMSSFACSTVIFISYPHIGLIFLLFACIMAFSRIYLFVHYLSDVLFAAICGLLIGYLITCI